MRFARADYDRRIIDLARKIPGDEPVWLLRAQDAAAPDTLDTWAYQHELRGGDRRLSFEARIVAQEMREWQAGHGKKTADVPADPAADLPDREVPLEELTGANVHGIGPDTAGGNNPEYVPTVEDMEAEFDRLVEQGLIVHAGEDENGNKLYRITAAGQAVVDALPGTGVPSSSGDPQNPPTGA